MAMDYTQMNGNLKEIYADSMNEATFDCDAFQKRAKFNTRKESGDSFVQPIKLANSHGFTYQAADSGIATLNDAITLQTKKTTVKGSQITGVEAIAYDVAERASSKGPKAFVAAWGLTVDGLLQAHAQRIDEQSLYGSVGLGVTAALTHTSSTVQVVTLTTASFAAGIWAGSVNRKVQFYDGVTLVSSGADSIFTVSAVDIDNRKLTVTGTSTGVTALKVAIGGSPLGSGSNDLDIYEYGAKGNEQLGVHYILTQDDKFGVNGATYDLWKGNQSAITGALTSSKVDAAINKAVNRGLREDVTLWTNPLVWGDLSREINSSRRWQGGEMKTKGGTSSIEYFGLNGKIEVVPYNLIKEGVSYVLPMKQVSRVGATDLSFRNSAAPGGNEGYFFELPSQTGMGLRTRSNQATYINYPSRCVVITGIGSS